MGPYCSAEVEICMFGCSKLLLEPFCVDEFICREFSFSDWMWWARKSGSRGVILFLLVFFSLFFITKEMTPLINVAIPGFFI